MILQYRYGKIQSIVSYAGSYMNPLNLNPGALVDGEQKRPMSITHRQCPVGAQHENTVESRIRLIKQYALNMISYSHLHYMRLIISPSLDTRNIFT